jgi:hypothetical protein
VIAVQIERIRATAHLGWQQRNPSAETATADIRPAIDHFAADRVILRLRCNRGTRPTTRSILVASVVRQRRRLKRDRRPASRRKHPAPRQPWPRLGPRLCRLLLPGLSSMLLLRLEICLEFFVIRPRNIRPPCSECSNLAARSGQRRRRQIRRKFRSTGSRRLLVEMTHRPFPCRFLENIIIPAAQS